MNEFNERMLKARKDADLTQDEAIDRLPRHIPKDYLPSRRTLIRYEQSMAEKNADALVLWAFSQVYECPLEQLSPRAAAAFRASGGDQPTGSYARRAESDSTLLGAAA